MDKKREAEREREEQEKWQREEKEEEKEEMRKVRREQKAMKAALNRGGISYSLGIGPLLDSMNAARGEKRARAG